MKRHQWAYLEGWISLIVNGTFFGLKVWVGMVSGSVAVMADAWHTLSDSLTSIVVLFGAAISRKPADAHHPFGHGRAETIASLIIGILLTIVGVSFIGEAVAKYKSHSQTTYGPLVFVVFACSVLAKEGLAQFSFWAGKKSANLSLKADGWHHRSDAIASALILLGAATGRYFWWIDSVLGVLVALLILYAAYEIIRDAVVSLMGEEPSWEIKQKIGQIVHDITGIDSAHHLHIHTYGEHKEVTLHIHLRPDMSLEKVHRIVEKVEQAVRKEIGLEATVHVEPHEPTAEVKTSKQILKVLP